MDSTLSDKRFNTIIMSSLPPSYRLTLQTITAAEQTSSLLGVMSKQLKPDDLLSFILEEAQHWLINEEQLKNAESALAAHTKKDKKGKCKHGKSSEKSQNDQLDVICENCHKPSHTKAKCWCKGGGKEGQGLRQKKSKKADKSDTAIVAVEEEKDELFAFVCTSDYANIANPPNSEIEAWYMPRQRCQ